LSNKQQEDNMEPILDRIRKLLRLASNNSNENEAASAMAKARTIMLEHNISHIDDTAPDIDMQPMRGQTHYQYDKQWQSFLANGIAALFHCRHTTNNLGAIAFWGRKANIAAAEETMAFVAAQIESFYKLTLKSFGGELGKKGRAELRATFKEAAAIRVTHRCQEIIAASERNRIPDYKALTVVNTTKEEIDNLFATHGVHKSKKLAKVRNGLGTGAGQAAGDAVRIQKETQYHDKPQTNVRQLQVLHKGTPAA
jgi:hypothetical protein